MRGRYANALNATASLYIRKATDLMLSGEQHYNEVHELCEAARVMLDEAVSHFEQIGNILNRVVCNNNRFKLNDVFAAGKHPIIIITGIVGPWDFVFR